MDMPVMMMDAADSVKSWDVSSQLSNVTHMFSVLREVWNRQTVADLARGNITVPDEVLNQSLQQALGDSDKVQEFTLTSLANNKIKIHLRTESVGTVNLVCRIKQFEHDQNHSVMKLSILDKQLPDRPLMSFIFSHISMALVTKLAGPIDVGPDLALAIDGNDVTVDFHQALLRSKLATVEVMGYRLLDQVEITGAAAQAGGVTFQTNLNVPQQVVDALIKVL
jgi:hypothetical protein